MSGIYVLNVEFRIIGGNRQSTAQLCCCEQPRCGGDPHDDLSSKFSVLLDLSIDSLDYVSVNLPVNVDVYPFRARLLGETGDEGPDLFCGMESCKTIYKESNEKKPWEP